MAANLTVDSAPVIGEGDKVGGPNVYVRRFGDVGGAVLIECVARLGLHGVAQTVVAIPIDFRVSTIPLRDLTQLDEAVIYTALIRDPDETSGPWTTVQAVATALGLSLAP